MKKTRGNDVMDLMSVTDAIDVEICDAANFLAAEGGSGAHFHRHGRELWHAMQDAYMRIGADSASTGPVTPEAIRDVLLVALGHYRRSLDALNEDLRSVSKRLP